MQSDQARAHIGVLFTNFFFALNLSLVQSISPDPLGPYGLNLFRVGGCLLLFWTITWITRPTDEKPIQGKDWWRLFTCGMTGVFLNQTLFIKGLTMTSTIHAALLMLSTPLVITGMAVFFIGERLRWTQALGLAMGLSGATLLIMDRTNMGEDSLFGDGLIVLNAISYAVYFILVKPLMQRYPPRQVIRWVFTFGAVGTIPLGIQHATDLSHIGMNGQQILALVTVVFCGTYLAYSFNIRAIQVLGASIAGSYIYLQPVFAALISILFLDEHFTVGKIIAAAMIFVGVYLSSRKRVEELRR